MLAMLFTRARDFDWDTGTQVEKKALKLGHHWDTELGHTGTPELKRESIAIGALP